MHHVGTGLIETPRLLLRRFTVEDAPAMYAGWANDPEVTRWMRWQPHPNVAFTRSMLEEWVKDYAKEDYYSWAIVRKEDNTLIGSIGILRNQEPQEPEGYEPGYCIGRAFWNHGYTTEALQAALDYFIKNTGIDTLYCVYAVGNPASGRVMEKAGFVFDHNGVYHKPDGTQIPAKYYILHTGSGNGRNE